MASVRQHLLGHPAAPCARVTLPLPSLPPLLLLSGSCRPAQSWRAKPRVGQWRVPELALEDCPLLPAGAVLPLQDPGTGRPLTHPDRGDHVTLADLSVRTAAGWYCCTADQVVGLCQQW